MSNVWMITGSSRGLGLQIVKSALATGHRVVATARSVDSIKELLGQQERLLTLVLDVTQPVQAEEAARAAVEHFGRIDVLVNNAGYGHLGPFEEASIKDIEQQYRVNVFGAMHVARVVLPYMRKQGLGRIFNISSVAGFTGGAMASLYCSSKFALEGWSESLTAELKPLGIQVTAIEPGFFRTDFLDVSSIRYTTVRQSEYRAGFEQLQGWMESKHGHQEGDPLKLAEVLLEIAGMEEQPTRLPLGSDALQYMKDRLQRDQKSIEQWAYLSTSTDYPA